MLAVLDTNVLISAFIKSKGNPADILRLIIEGKLPICQNPAILTEYEGVAGRSKFASKIDPDKVRRFIDLLQKISISHTPSPSTIALPDEDDRIFYDTAKELGAYLITGNIRHYPNELFILNPADFLTLFNASK
ncbi:putative toxin-antitoxin system toxin component, PIN family [Treponema primitia]|uniref:putative toxin-antitoxin system toxin component, PIN family n=1 Tax=Treponema primitia TaxID=88058 RepID=UPI00397ED891